MKLRCAERTRVHLRNSTSAASQARVFLVSRLNHAARGLVREFLALKRERETLRTKLDPRSSAGVTRLLTDQMSLFHDSVEFPQPVLSIRDAPYLLPSREDSPQATPWQQVTMHRFRAHRASARRLPH